MSAYTLNHAYGASRDGRRFGPWEAGETVELEPADAEWIERDSPGALVDVKAGKGERQKPPTADRQHRGGANRGG